MTLRVCVLASGSSGNATAIWSDEAGLLVDCGCSRRYIEESLEAIGFDVRKLKGIIITHGHGDHFGTGAINIARTYGAPIYIHRTTLMTVSERHDCRKVIELDWNLLKLHGEDAFNIAGFLVQPFATFHRGGFTGKPFGFSILHEAERPCKISCLTDTGKIDENIIGALLHSNVMVIEANHDPEMVDESNRPYANKQWVLSDYGHLSNEASARTILQVIERSGGQRGMSHVFLAHISKQHNTVEKALAQVGGILERNNAGGITLIPTYHRQRSAVLDLAG